MHGSEAIKQPSGAGFDTGDRRVICADIEAARVAAEEELETQRILTDTSDQVFHFQGHGTQGAT
jgi:hypothetical protein